MILPAVGCLLRDRRTRGAPREAYLFLLPDLDLVRYTPVKTLLVQHGLSCNRRAACDALRKLVDLGYLEKGEPDETGVNTYRLVWACPIGSEIAPPRSA